MELTCQWAREAFDALYVNPPTTVNLYLSQPNFVETTLKSSGQHHDQLKQIEKYLVKERPTTFSQCIEWARLQFEQDYVNEIKQLLFNLPKDQVNSNGTPFWSGPKRAPDPLEFDLNNVSRRLPTRWGSADTSLCTSNTSSRLPTCTLSTTASRASATRRCSKRSSRRKRCPSSLLRAA